MTSGTHTYFERLASRLDCHVAFGLRSQAQLDSIETGATSDRKKPVVYDPVMDAAQFSIYAPVSSDSQQKILPVGIDNGSMLLTWDFRFDRYFSWVREGYLGTHKTFRFDPGPWITFKTDYKYAAHRGQLAELFVSINSASWLGPGTTRGEREILFPRLTQFFVQPDTWTRVWVFVENIDQPVAKVSIWAADERRDPVQLYDRIAMIPPMGGLNYFRMEYDTSAGPTDNPDEMHSWNRNWLILRNVPASEVPSLLARP
jgi:hypothetical protein